MDPGVASLTNVLLYAVRGLLFLYLSALIYHVIYMYCACTDVIRTQMRLTSIIHLLSGELPVLLLQGRPSGSSLLNVRLHLVQYAAAIGMGRYNKSIINSHTVDYHSNTTTLKGLSRRRASA